MKPRAYRIFLATLIALSAASLLIVVKGYLDLFAGLSGLFFSNGQPLGGDFIAFYTGGKLFSGASADGLYDFDSQFAFQSEFFSLPKGEFPFLPFVYPPIVAAFFSLLKPLSFPEAYGLWVLVSIILVFASTNLLVQALGAAPFRFRVLSVIFAFAFTPLSIDTLAGGQLSALAIGIITFGFFLMRRQQMFVAGVLFSACYYKAPLFAPLLFALFVFGPTALRFGLVAGGCFLFAIELILVGPHGLFGYYSFVSEYLSGSTEQLSYQSPASLGVGVYAALRTYETLGIIAYGLLGVLWMALLYRWRKQQIVELFPFLIISSLTLSIQVNDYDLALLLIPLVIYAHGFGRQLQPNQTLLLLFFGGCCLHSFSVLPEGVLLPASFFLVALLQERAFHNEYSNQTQFAAPCGTS